MSRLIASMGIVVAFLAGMGGCNKGTPGTQALHQRLKSLESKSSRLEIDLRAACAARDQLRDELLASKRDQELLRQELAELRGIANERDSLKATVERLTSLVEERTQERDVAIAENELLRNQFEQFRNGLRVQLEQFEASLSPGTPPSIPLIPTATEETGWFDSNESGPSLGS